MFSCGRGGSVHHRTGTSSYKYDVEKEENIFLRHELETFDLVISDDVTSHIYLSSLDKHCSTSTD